MAGTVVSNGVVAGQTAGVAFAQHSDARRSRQSAAASASYLPSARRCGTASKPFLSGSSLLLPQSNLISAEKRKNNAVQKGETTCGLLDFVGRDLLRFDTGKWYEDVEQNGAMAMYMPLEGGPEGRYVLKLKDEGYHILNLNARGLGDPEAYLMKVHGVRPAHFGKEPIATFYMPPEVDFRLSLLHPDSKGLVLWLTDGKVLSRAELQYLTLIPVLRPKVRVVVEMGGARQVEWYPLKEIVGMPPPDATILPGEKKTQV
ncbi:NAD(P)H:plastoquinone dehydrogenase complex subunit N [Klebsormidium nitens]|uniref:NAD(P)H:plastoquinone dehydrogenase complex subunit N n=1 Tax=Klebsormidium nitens TaxID=105231 RepID=A0A1Y1ILZ7_KLENI|nr:NAD(P)H:plastoquinone dehydrogenase complex subunit N [Klebsormidium nitens]|eukprot:GAQ89806.1 NAD(P)H:plastoquinone dehydrogenase complex subunit N [Klebsormidium nitens]